MLKFNATVGQTISAMCRVRRLAYCWKTVSSNWQITYYFTSNTFLRWIGIFPMNGSEYIDKCKPMYHVMAVTVLTPYSSKNHWYNSCHSVVKVYCYMYFLSWPGYVSIGILCYQHLYLQVFSICCKSLYIFLLLLVLQKLRHQRLFNNTVPANNQSRKTLVIK